jgi:hypothetical protein
MAKPTLKLTWCMVSLRMSRVLLFRALSPLLLGVGLATSAQQSNPGLTPRQSPQATANYRIGGKVVDAHTGAALARCSVEIAGVKASSPPRTVVTGEDGGFTFNGLPLGKYSLTAQHRGYLAQSYEEHDQYSTAIAVGPALDSESLIFKLTADAVITGTIVDEVGEPVRAAQVRLFQDQDADGIRTTQQRHAVNTDDRGVYEIPDVRPGTYFLVATGHPWYAQHVQHSDVTEAVDQTSEAQALDVAYPTTFYPGVTDQDAATPIPVKGGERLEANLTLAAQPAMRLHLNVPQGEGGHNFSVMLNQTVFGQVETLPAQLSFGAGGSVEVEGVLPGHYDVTLNQFSPGQNKSDTKHFDADVASGATELSEESGVGEVTVTGKVVSAEGKLPASVGIALRAAQGRRQYGSPVDEKGEFSIGAPPSVYEVVGEISDMYIAGIKVSGATLNGRTLTLKTGDSPKLEVLVGSGFGEIEGTALNGDKPASAVMVLLAPEDPKNNQILFRRDQSDSDGTFDVLNIVPGRYRLLAIERGWELEWANPNVLQAFLAKAVPIEVKPGDHLKKSVEVQAR